MKLISEQYCGSLVKIVIGERIAVQLPENPTTGYSWDSSDWYYPDNVDVLLNEFKPTPPVRIGSGGYRRWVLKPNNVGNYQFVFGYQRAWETKPARIFKFSLTVVEPEPLPKEEDPKNKKTKKTDV